MGASAGDRVGKQPGVGRRGQVGLRPRRRLAAQRGADAGPAGPRRRHAQRDLSPPAGAPGAAPGPAAPVAPDRGLAAAVPVPGARDERSSRRSSRSSSSSTTCSGATPTPSSGCTTCSGQAATRGCWSSGPCGRRRWVAPTRRRCSLRRFARRTRPPRSTSGRSTRARPASWPPRSPDGPCGPAPPDTSMRRRKATRCSWSRRCGRSRNAGTPGRQAPIPPPCRRTCTRSSRPGSGS